MAIKVLAKTQLVNGRGGGRLRGGGWGTIGAMISG